MLTDMEAARSSRLAPTWLGLAAALLCAATPGAPARAQPAPGGEAGAAPMTVTTDTRDYCRQLHQQLEVTRDPPDEVRTLSAEGWKMCSQGHVIGGLARLRRAVAILRDGDGER